MPLSETFQGHGAQPVREVFVRSNAGFPSRGEAWEEGHGIAWGLGISHCDLGGDRRLVRLSAWALRMGERPSTVDRIVFRNAAGPVHVATANVRRPDVLRALSIAAGPKDTVAICGFKGQFETRDTQLEVLIETGDAAFAIGRVEFQPAVVLAGADGWLFLAGDANDSVAQHCTDFHADARWLARWADYFAAMPGIAAPKVAFIVAPAKESVIPDRYPAPFRARTPIAQLLSTHSGKIVFPLPEMRACRDFAYDRADTHWTDLGARVACDALLAHLGETAPAIPALYEITSARGDLGDKLVPPESTIRASAAWPGQSRLVFDNLVLHHGSLRIFTNPDAPIHKTVAIFGGSSSEQMIRYLGAIYSRIVSLYGAGSWDPAIIAQESPDIVVLQTNERFLVTPPLPSFDSVAIAGKKIRAGHVTAAGNYTENLSRFKAMGEDSYIACYAAIADDQG